MNHRCAKKLNGLEIYINLKLILRFRSMFSVMVCLPLQKVVINFWKIINEFTDAELSENHPVDVTVNIHVDLHLLTQAVAGRGVACLAPCPVKISP